MRRLLILMMVLGACSSTSASNPNLATDTIEIGDERLIVWVADDAAERRQGLRGVDSLPEGVDGMLFVYESPVSVSFTMSDTPIALDIWWFDPEGRLVGSAQMDPCIEGPCTSYRSPGPVGWVLETPAGDLDLVIGAIISTVETA